MQTDKATTLLRAVVGFDGLHFDPKTLIKAVNYFRTLGREQSIQVLKILSASGVSESHAVAEKVLMVARGLFVPADQNDELPRLNLGVPDTREPSDPKAFPMFPLALLQGIPFLVIGGYLGAGQSESPLAYITWCAEKAVLRPTPLVPDNNPLQVVDEFMDSAQWKDMATKPWHYAMLRAQALRAVSNIYPVIKGYPQNVVPKLADSEVWRSYRQQFSALNVIWDCGADDYILKGK